MMQMLLAVHMVTLSQIPCILWPILNALWYGMRVNRHFQYASSSKQGRFRYQFWPVYPSVNT